ncbi:hypothetical protein LSH36_338g03003 [Paralvinella palmiformis]|uniref:Uncharacterized protein n=1 Tax=Paralvinella palmiformis TaxID=53620 RepID=A0AAD9N0E6_9ANNE|nr:hypothetical protein LSH36_338g03003 [Paralvinella palmiformis]
MIVLCYTLGALNTVSSQLIQAGTSPDLKPFSTSAQPRNTELVPLLSQPEPQHRDKQHLESSSSVPKSTSSVTLPVSSPSSHSQFDTQQIIVDDHQRSPLSSPQEVERRLDELASQLTRLEDKMSSDISMILRILQQNHAVVDPVIAKLTPSGDGIHLKQDDDPFPPPPPEADLASCQPHSTDCESMTPSPPSQPRTEPTESSADPTQSSAHLPQSSAHPAQSSSRPDQSSAHTTRALSPEKQRQLGLPEGIDLKNSDV